MAPVSDYKLDELGRAAEVSPRTIRYYVQRGLLPPAEFRGKDTAYDEGHLLRLKAIKRLQAQSLPLDAIQARLASASLAELEQLASGRSPPASPPPSVRVEPVPVSRSERWERLVLAPGLELHLSSEASPAVRRLALEIQTAHARDKE